MKTSGLGLALLAAQLAGAVEVIGVPPKHELMPPKKPLPPPLPVELNGDDWWVDHRKKRKRKTRKEPTDGPR